MRIIQIASTAKQSANYVDMFAVAKENAAFLKDEIYRAYSKRKNDLLYTPARALQDKVDSRLASTDFPIHVAGEMSKEDLTAEQLYQKYMTVASQRDAHVAVLHALSEVTREMYPAKSYGPASRMATANIKTV